MDMPDAFKTQKMCNQVVKNGANWVFDFVHEEFRTQVDCVKVVERNIWFCNKIPDEFKAREMCEQVIESGHSSLLDYLPDWFVRDRQLSK